MPLMLVKNCIQAINEKTWLNQNITPYELYLKFLYEYFKDELSRTDEVFTKYLPQDFKRLEYQQQAVLNAKKILEEYGGVFISDVVGLGKTYVATMLAGQLDGRTIIIAPPALLNRNNPGSWPNVFSDFHIPAEFVSIGKLEYAKDLLKQREYRNIIIIDEAHRFRTEITISYEDVAEICRGRRVILVSATPYNNSPRDILAQIKLFQNARKSIIPGVPNLEEFFVRLEGRLKKIDRQKDYNKFLDVTRSNAREIRDKVLKYLMVRRTRGEIEKYFAEDLKKNNVKFPEVEDPKPFCYQLNDEEDRIFMKTVELITQKFTYARYTPLLYLKKHNILGNKNNKIVIFTESKETAEYLTQNINKEFGEIALLFHGDSSEIVRDKVIENFDARVRNKKDDYKILVSTEVLSEGVNLHRSNIVINYDIPWNPTRLMQRVGRINRIDTSFDRIYTFNFFPTKQADTEIELTNIARSKIEAFLTLLGGDTSILTEGEPVSSHELFDKLLSKKTITEDEEGESELQYLRVIEDIRDKNPELFEKIKHLPKKARSGKIFSQSLKDIVSAFSLLTFFRKGKLMKFFLSNKKSTLELDFLSAAKILESSQNEKRAKLPLKDYYELLDKNKTAFFDATVKEIIRTHRRGGRDSETKLLKALKATQKNSKQLTEDQEEYLKKVINKLEEGSLPKKTVQRTLKALDKLGKDIQNPLKVIGILQREISFAFLRSHYAETSAVTEGKREVILSLYLSEENNENA